MGAKPLESHKRRRRFNPLIVLLVVNTVRGIPPDPPMGTAGEPVRVIRVIELGRDQKGANEAIVLIESIELTEVTGTGANVDLAKCLETLIHLRATTAMPQNDPVRDGRVSGLRDRPIRVLGLRDRIRTLP